MLKACKAKHQMFYFLLFLVMNVICQTPVMDKFERWCTPKNNNSTAPENVHQVRPEHIGVMMALGDRYAQSSKRVLIGLLINHLTPMEIVKLHCWFE